MSIAAMPERHLGLLPAAEIEGLAQAQSTAWPTCWRRRPAATLPPAVSFDGRAGARDVALLLAGKTIANPRATRPSAFSIRPILTALERLGATLRYFSPLVDADFAGVRRGSGCPVAIPNCTAKRWRQNRTLWQSLAAHVEAGKPVLAECGGMMALFETLCDVEGREHRLAGLLPGRGVHAKAAGRPRDAGSRNCRKALCAATLSITRRPKTALTPDLHVDAPGRDASAKRSTAKRRLTASYMHLLLFRRTRRRWARLFSE